MLFLRVIVWCGAEKFSLKKSCFYLYIRRYHMNKQHWITILLDGSVSEAKVLDFLDMSYDLIDGAGGKEENVSGLQ